jgi:primary-amine oxidase
VVWHSSGHTHVCKPEYFQIMPVEFAGFMFKPVGFFAANAGFDIPPERNHSSVLSGEAGAGAGSARCAG